QALAVGAHTRRDSKGKVVCEEAGRPAMPTRAAVSRTTQGGCGSASGGPRASYHAQGPRRLIALRQPPPAARDDVLLYLARAAADRVHDGVAVGALEAAVERGAF